MEKGHFEGIMKGAREAAAYTQGQKVEGVVITHVQVPDRVRGAFIDRKYLNDDDDTELAREVRKRTYRSMEPQTNVRIATKPLKLGVISDYQIFIRDVPDAADMFARLKVEDTWRDNPGTWSYKLLAVKLRKDDEAVPVSKVKERLGKKFAVEDMDIFQWIRQKRLNAFGKENKEGWRDIHTIGSRKELRDCWCSCRELEAFDTGNIEIRLTGTQWVDDINGRFISRHNAKPDYQALDDDKEHFHSPYNYQNIFLGALACVLYGEEKQYQYTDIKTEEGMYRAAQKKGVGAGNWPPVWMAYEALRDAVDNKLIQGTNPPHQYGDWKLYEVPLKEALVWCKKQGVKLDEVMLAYIGEKAGDDAGKKPLTGSERTKLINCVKKEIEQLVKDSPDLQKKDCKNQISEQCSERVFNDAWRNANIPLHKKKANFATERRKQTY